MEQAGGHGADLGIEAVVSLMEEGSGLLRMHDPRVNGLPVGTDERESS